MCKRHHGFNLNTKKKEREGGGGEEEGNEKGEEEEEKWGEKETRENSETGTLM